MTEFSLPSRSCHAGSPCRAARARCLRSRDAKRREGISELIFDSPWVATFMSAGLAGHGASAGFFASSSPAGGEGRDASRECGMKGFALVAIIIARPPGGLTSRYELRLVRSLVRAPFARFSIISHF
jgi:hypothetical protein